MESNNLVTAEELFYLLVHRSRDSASSKEIKAKNLEEYSWTWLNFSYVQRSVNSLGLDLEDVNSELLKTFKDEANKKYYADSKPETIRIFSLISVMEIKCLVDEKGFSWYQAQTEGDYDVTLWAYPGKFRLLAPVSDEDQREVKKLIAAKMQTLSL